MPAARQAVECASAFRPNLPCHGYRREAVATLLTRFGSQGTRELIFASLTADMSCSMRMLMAQRATLRSFLDARPATTCAGYKLNRPRAKLDLSDVGLLRRQRATLHEASAATAAHARPDNDRADLGKDTCYNDSPASRWPMRAGRGQWRARQSRLTSPANCKEADPWIRTNSMRN